MIAGDLDLERTVWDVEYRRRVIAFLADLNGSHAGAAVSPAPASGPSADIIPFPERTAAPAPNRLRRAAKS
jgi:hypothetical protein